MWRWFKWVLLGILVLFFIFLTYAVVKYGSIYLEVRKINDFGTCFENGYKITFYMTGDRKTTCTLPDGRFFDMPKGWLPK